MLVPIAWGTTEATFPFFIKELVDTLAATSGGVYETFYAARYVLLALVLVWVVSEVLIRLQGFVQIYTFPFFRAQIREATFNYVKHHSHDYFSQNFAGNLSKKLSDLPSSCQDVLEIIFFNFITAGVGAAIALVMMWFVQPMFALILFTWLFFHLGITFIFLRRGHKLWSDYADALSALNGKVVDIFSNIMSMRIFSRGDYELQYLKKSQNIEIKKSQKAMLTVEFMRIALGINGVSLILVTMFTLVYAYSQQWITMGDFAQVGMQSFWLLGWAWYITFQLSMLIKETGTIDDCLELIRKSHDLKDISDAKSLIVHKGEIEFSHVNFSYQKNRYIFKDLNIKIPAGQKIGLVGFSGTGKSTFVNLLLRFYDVTSGKISIDSQSIAEVTQDSLREYISMIPQDPSLFHRTLIENIRYGKLDATEKEVMAASKLAHCHEFIKTLDNGYDTMVGERGIKLSGGQRQRIAIARAILKNAPILILDEATSSLDSVTEKLIQESLHELMRGKTTIVVAHRLSTLDSMDRILVFDQGKVVEDGTKKELLAAKGYFYKLWNMQTHGFLPDDIV